MNSESVTFELYNSFATNGTDNIVPKFITTPFCIIHARFNSEPMLNSMYDSTNHLKEVGNKDGHPSPTLPYMQP